MNDQESDEIQDSADGVPDYADPDSRAWDTGVDSNREDAAALPRERGERPLGIDEYGTTAAEAKHREPLANRLAREEPDIDAYPEELPDSETTDPDATDLRLSDLDTPDDGSPDFESADFDSGYDSGTPRRRSAVSTLDYDDEDGRQVRPEAAAEEAAMHTDEL